MHETSIDLSTSLAGHAHQNGAIKGSSRERLYQELGLESLSDRRWYRRLVYFFNIAYCNSPIYLYSLLPAKQRSYDPIRSNLFRNFTSRTTFFKNSFFPYCTSEWNKLGPNLRNSTSISIFIKSLLAFIRPKPCYIYNIIDPPCLKILTRLRVNLSHLIREHKFHHNFLDTLNPLCSCSLEIESTSHYLLRCPLKGRIQDSIIVSQWSPPSLPSFPSLLPFPPPLPFAPFHPSPFPPTPSPISAEIFLESLP